MKTTLHNKSGYTLTEVMVASALASVVLAMGIMVYSSSVRTWRGFELRSAADRTLNMAMSQIVYGVDGHRGLRAADSNMGKFSVTSNNNGWTIDYEYESGDIPVAQKCSFAWKKTTREIIFTPGDKVIATDVSDSKVTRDGLSIKVEATITKNKNKIKAVRSATTLVFLRN
jgi:prepilin-type N-terminal cleavage/methylation domain-containing protein